MARRRGAALLALLLLLGCVATRAAATEGEVRWRLAERDGTMALFAAEHDATDNFASPSFECRKGSGSITVIGEMSDQDREAVAGLIRKNEYPRVDLIPPMQFPALLGSIIYLEMGGWIYKFEIDAGTRALAEFAATGVFQYQIEDSVTRVELKAGLENIAAFERACRQPTR